MKKQRKYAKHDSGNTHNFCSVQQLFLLKPTCQSKVESHFYLSTYQWAGEIVHTKNALNCQLGREKVVWFLGLEICTLFWFFINMTYEDKYLD